MRKTISKKIINGNEFIHEILDGYEYYNKNGLLHREDGPAAIYPNGMKAWCINGMAHREDGPATEYPDGTVDYYLNGDLIDCSTNEEWLKILKLKAFL